MVNSEGSPGDGQEIRDAVPTLSSLIAAAVTGNFLTADEGYLVWRSHGVSKRRSEGSERCGCVDYVRRVRGIYIFVYAAMRARLLQRRHQHQHVALTAPAVAVPASYGSRYVRVTGTVNYGYVLHGDG